MTQPRTRQQHCRSGSIGRLSVQVAAVAICLAWAGQATAGSEKQPNAESAHVSHGGGGGGVPRLPGNTGGGPHVPGNTGGAHLPGNMGEAHVPGNMSGAHLPGNMGEAHVPGNMSGAHLPGNMGEAHVPGNMNGAHLPGNMGEAHVPGNMSGAAHTPGEVGGGAHLPGGIASVHGPESGHSAPSGHPGGSEPPQGMAHVAGARTEVPEAGHTGMAQGVGAHPGFAERSSGGFAEHGPGETGPARLTPGFGIRHEAAVQRSFLRADERRDVAHDRTFVNAHQGDFHTRAVRDFSTREMTVWRRGLWRNEWHYGRRGWWWEVDGVWYGYPEPVYPYPLVVAPLTVYETSVVEGPNFENHEMVATGPGGVVSEAVAAGGTGPGSEPPAADVAMRDVPAGEPAPQIAPLPMPPEGWYRCVNPSGYFPALGSCRVAWELTQQPPPP